MSGDLSGKLLELDDFLLSEVVGEDAMLLAELDGFLAGVIVCPDMIMPSEWLPAVWGEEAPVFENEDQAQSVLDLIMGHYNDILRHLDRGRYRPVYDVDRDGSLLWETWVEGFWRAPRLRPEAWLAYAEEEDEDLQRALFALGRLGEFASRPDDFQPMEIDAELESVAPDLIPDAVETLHRARLARAGASAGPVSRNRPKAGRNDPCPCGSGKKYKKCCLT